MIIFSYFVLLVGITGAVTDDLFGLKLTTEKIKAKDETKYRFRYFVKDDLTGDYKTQEEIRDGDSVQGSYTIGEPNGDLRTVTYTAGPGRGFEATVDVQPSGSPMISTKIPLDTVTTFQGSIVPGKRFSHTVRTEKPSYINHKIKHIAKGLIKDLLKKSTAELKEEIETLIKESNDTENGHEGKQTEAQTEVPSSSPKSSNTEEFTVKLSEVEADLAGSPSTESSGMVTTKSPENINKSNPIIKLITSSPMQRTEMQNLSKPKTNKPSGLTKQLKEETPTTLPSMSSTPEEGETESTTLTSEGRDIIEDPIEKEINDAINSMPKLPEFILSDNITHLKFHKDPEEALLDERITQIARQLAETSLRREYEERKLGHIIPISLRPIERSTSSYLSKAFKFTPNDMPAVRQSSPVHVLTQVRLVPQYIYKDAFFPKFTQIHQRLPVYTKSEKDRVVYDTVTDPQDILKISQPEQISAVVNADTLRYDTTPQQPVSSIPVQMPTFVQFFTPLQRFFMNTQKAFAANNKPEFLISAQDLTTSAIPASNDGVYFAAATINDDHNTEKS